MRKYLYPLLCALLIVHFQKQFFFNIGLKDMASFGSGTMNFFLLSLVSGIIFGLISCPVCGLALSFALGSTETYLNRVIYKNILFHSARSLIIFTYAFLGSFMRVAIDSVFQDISLVLGGSIMILMGSCMLGFLRFKGLLFKKKNYSSINGFTYFFLGASLGSVCSFEATGFLVPLWLTDTSGLFVKSTGFFLFSFAAVLPVIIMSIAVYLGFKGMNSLLKGKARSFLLTTSGFFLILFGTVFIVSFLKRF